MGVHRRVRPRTAVAALLAAAVSCSLAGCSSSDPAADRDTAARAADVAWNPCDGLTAGKVGRVVGGPVVERSGTAGQPRCAFTPAAKGGPAFDVSYLWFDGGLDAALDAMGAPGRQLRPVRVPGSDAARLAVRTRPSGVLVTGFVQTGGLVQSVNAVQLAPYDERTLVAGTRRLLAALAKAAPSSPS